MDKDENVPHHQTPNLMDTKFYWLTVCRRGGRKWERFIKNFPSLCFALRQTYTSKTKCVKLTRRYPGGAGFYFTVFFAYLRWLTMCFTIVVIAAYGEDHLQNELSALSREFPPQGHVGREIFSRVLRRLVYKHPRSQLISPCCVL